MDREKSFIKPSFCLRLPGVIAWWLILTIALTSTKWYKLQRISL
nr:MAG TPA: hypothetical protein [Caudoviricetes sp.]